MRKLKFSPGQFKDCLLENSGPIPVSKLAEMMACSRRTTRKYLKMLRDEGLPVLPTRKGILLADKISDKEIANLVKGCATWIIKGFVGLVLIGSVTKEPLKISYKKFLPKSDKKMVRNFMLQMIQAEDMREIEEELNPAELPEKAESK